MPVPSDVSGGELTLALGPEVRQHDVDAEVLLSSARLRLEGCSQAELLSAQILLGQACLVNNLLQEARQAAKEAMLLSREADDARSVVASQVLMCEVHLAADEMDQVMATSAKLVALSQQAGDTRGLAAALGKQAQAYCRLGQPSESLRTAERALKAWQQTDDRAGEVDALVTEAEAKLNICEERMGGAGGAASVTLTLVNCVKTARLAAERYRSRDHSCLGTALYTHARVLLLTSNWKQAEHAARGSAKAFRKARNLKRRAEALTLWAEADLRRGFLQDARNNALRAQDIFEQVGSIEGLAKVSDVFDMIDQVLGVPTQAELEFKRQQQMLADQQQYLMWQQQQQQGGPTALSMGLQMVQHQQQAEGTAANSQDRASGAIRPREGGALNLGAGVDEQTINKKVMEVVRTILGDDEEIELDIPLMEAGMTSNNAVLLRDELATDLPGIHLPPTLIFDYPSVSSITEYIMEKSIALK